MFKRLGEDHEKWLTLVFMTSSSIQKRKHLCEKLGQTTLEGKTSKNEETIKVKENKSATANSCSSDCRDGKKHKY